MDIFSFDFSSLFTMTNLLAIIVGSLIGLFFGAIPGIGSMVILVLLLPISFLLPPLPAILLLLSVYQSAEYGGSISSILIGIPGSSSNVATLMDGYPMTKNGEPGKALGISLLASTLGGLFGGLVLVFLSGPVAGFALKLSYPEYFMVALLGVLAVAAISSDNMIKAIISGMLGLMAGTVGLDMITGTQRFTFGRMELMDGLSMIPVVVGLFAFTEVAFMISDSLKDKKKKANVNVSTKLSAKDTKKILKPVGVASTIGAIVGIFPGTGSATASWFGYSAAKKTSKDPQSSFGKGNPEGLAGSDSASNAAVGGAVLPMLTLGVPGSPAIALIMGAFIMHGIVPGPHIFESEPLLTYGILWGFLLTSVAMYFSGRLFTPLFARVLKTPMEILIPIVLVISIIGAYAANFMFFEVWLAIGVALIAYFMKKLNYSLPAFVLAFILGGIIESNFRRTMMNTGGDFTVFLTRPVSLTILIFIVLIFFFSIRGQFKKKKVEEEHLEAK